MKREMVGYTTVDITTLLTSQIAMSNAQSNRSQFATGSQRHRDPRFTQYAFTEHGALMAGNILRSERAIQMSVFIDARKPSSELAPNALRFTPYDGRYAMPSALSPLLFFTGVAQNWVEECL